ncbi:MAG TPA: thrombospondin type 3 repeat-containing protein [Dehalococcoidia bacterium]|nr:thrombospondin type 3 repeat-containing protein [Dehalococcoidia bacterium]
MQLLTGFRRLGLLAALALASLFVARGETQAIDFNPAATITMDHPVSGANADVVVTTDFPAGGSIFSSVLTFIPSSFGIGECAADNPAGVTAACADVAVPNGAIIGKVTSDTTLGLLNGACTQVLHPFWDMMDATTDMSQTVVFHDTDSDGKGQQFQDANGNGLPDGVDLYPEYLTRLLRDEAYNPGDPGASTPLQPIQRTYGQTNVGGDDVSLQFVTFPPGTKINGTQTDPNWGFMSVLVIQDTGDPGRVLKPSSITDFCAPNHGVTTLYGFTRDNPATAANEGGHMYMTNPVPGATGSIVLASSEADEDSDGLENTLDTCATQGNNDGWNPRTESNVGDNDQDGIPNICDPTPDAANADQDGDGFQNRGDNCPLIANANQLDVDRDDLGDVCDPEPGAPGATVPAILQWGALFTAPFQGDSDCGGTVNAVDALFTLRFVAGISPFAPCVFVGGDANCDGHVNSVDALAMLRHAAGLPVNQQQPCTAVGEVIPS